VFPQLFAGGDASGLAALSKTEGLTRICDLHG
jgi:hypothetical protein